MSDILLPVESGLESPEVIQQRELEWRDRQLQVFKRWADYNNRHTEMLERWREEDRQRRTRPRPWWVRLIGWIFRLERKS